MKQKLKRSIAFPLFWSLTLSGCHLGNLVVQRASQLSNSSSSGAQDQVSGYYVAEPKAVSFNATHSESVVREATTDLIPDFIGNYMTNPVAFILDNPDTGSAYFVPPQGQNGLPVSITSDSQLTYQGTTTPKMLWRDTGCKSFIEVTENGTLVANPNIASPPGNHHTLTGGIQLTIQVKHHLQGECTTTLQALYQCYLESEQCGGSTSKDNLALQTRVMSYFAPWINSGTIESSDIPFLKNYGYEVIYDVP